MNRSNVPLYLKYLLSSTISEEKNKKESKKQKEKKTMLVFRLQVVF